MNGKELTLQIFESYQNKEFDLDGLMKILEEKREDLDQELASELLEMAVSESSAFPNAHELEPFDNGSKLYNIAKQFLFSYQKSEVEHVDHPKYNDFDQEVKDGRISAYEAIIAKSKM